MGQFFLQVIVLFTCDALIFVNGWQPNKRHENVTNAQKIKH